MAKSVVITGVSTGIGHGIASVLLRSGFKVFGTVRGEADADRLRSEFGPVFTPLIADVTDQPAILRAADLVQESLAGATLSGLVNNAGISVFGPLLHQSLPEFRRQLEVNLVAPLLVSQAFAGLLGVDRTRSGNPGRIVNISSVGGNIGPPFLGAYAASKHGLEGMSESLRRELLLYGIDVILVGPGYVNTAILDKAQAEDLGVHRGTDYSAILERFINGFVAAGREGMSPVRVGEVVHTALTVRQPNVRYAVVQRKFINWTLPTSLPKRWVDRLVGKQLGLLPALSRLRRH